MVYYTPSSTPRALEENENAYTFADNRKSSIYQPLSVDWVGVGQRAKTVGLVIYAVAITAYSIGTGDPYAAENAWAAVQ